MHSIKIREEFCRISDAEESLIEEGKNIQPGLSGAGKNPFIVGTAGTSQTLIVF